MSFNQSLLQLKQHSENNIGDGTDESLILSLELSLRIKLPAEFRQYLLEIGYAEIYGNEIYSIYDIPDTVPCQGLHWRNKDNPYLGYGLIEFFSNDIDGTFYIHQDTGFVYLNSKDNLFAHSFSKFVNTLLDD